MKKLTVTFLLSLVVVSARAQEVQEDEQSTLGVENTTPAAQNHETQARTNQQKRKPAKLPNYGSLMIDVGSNFFITHPSNMALNYFGSRFFSGSIYYNIPLGNSHFVVSPGIGMSLNRYAFKNVNSILVRDKKSRNTVLEKGSTHFPQSSKITHVALNMRYMDLMLEAKFNANKQEPKRGFFVALGGKVCWLWRASTVVTYKEDNAVKKQKNLENFNLNKTRLGGYARLGWGRFGLCYTCIFSSLFQEDKGPDNAIQTSSITLSVDLF